MLPNPDVAEKCFSVRGLNCRLIRFVKHREEVVGDEAFKFPRVNQISPNPVKLYNSEFNGDQN